MNCDVHVAVNVMGILNSLIFPEGYQVRCVSLHHVVENSTARTAVF